MNVAAETRTASVRTGAFNYLATSTAGSLYRNGKVLTRRDSSGNDIPWEGTAMEERQMPVCDARGLAGSERRTLEANGFELLERSSAPADIDFLHHDQVVGAYYPHCADIVREATGARLVAAFDHNIRSVSGNRSRRRIEGGQQVQGPARVVHGDYTLTSAPQRLRDLAQPPTGNDTYRTQLSDGASLLDEARVTRALGEGRFAIVQSLAQHRRGAGRQPTAGALRRVQRASRRSGGLRDPLRRPDRRELLCQALRRPSLVLLFRPDP